MGSWRAVTRLSICHRLGHVKERHRSICTSARELCSFPNPGSLFTSKWVVASSPARPWARPPAAYHHSVSGAGSTLAVTSGTVTRTGRVSGPPASHCNYQSVRHKYRGQKDDETEQSGDSDDDDSDTGDEDEEFRHFFLEDADFPNNFREIKKHVKSLRVDAVLGGGLNIARSKILDYFLESKILVNGEKVLKKSKQVKEGDYVDLVSEVIDGKMKVKRVRLVKLATEKSPKDKYVIFLRVWKANVTIDIPPKGSPRPGT